MNKPDAKHIRSKNPLKRLYENIQSALGANSGDETQGWIAFIDAEVRVVCEGKGWGHQIRRKWAVREKPVSDSPIDDYEWKLIPGTTGRLADPPPSDFEGVYYVLRFDKRNGSFVFQHDTGHCGIMGPHWEVATYTEIRPLEMTIRAARDQRGVAPEYPPVGWLQDHLVRLTTRFKPNTFSVT